MLRPMAGKEDIAQDALAGKSTLQRLEANGGAASRYSKITYWRDAIDEGTAPPPPLITPSLALSLWPVRKAA